MMGFKDEYVPSGGFIGKEEKKELAVEGTVFNATAARLVVGGGFQGKGDQIVVEVDLDGEPRSLGFPTDVVPTRARMLSQLISYFGKEDAEPVPMKLLLGQDNRTYLVELV